MALASDTAKNAALNGMKGTGSTNYMTHVSLHTATTGTTGASEYSGVTRQAVTWNTPSGGSMTNSGQLNFTTSGASPVTYIGTWNASTSGTFAIGAALSSSVQAVSITIAAGAITFTAA